MDTSKKPSPKKTIILRTIGICAILLSLSPISPSLAAQKQNAAIIDAEDKNDTAAVESVAAYLEGVMSTTAQAAIDPNFVGVQMTTCRITPADAQPDSVYLYQEQALVENLDAPYRQRFLQVTPGDNNRTDSRTFRPDAPEQWIGLCSRPMQPLNTVALGESVCTVSLRPSSVGGYVGSTPFGGCAANVRGAVSITNVVVLSQDGMDTWDRGFDAAGNQVWGAEDVPYRYRR